MFCFSNPILQLYARGLRPQFNRWHFQVKPLLVKFADGGPKKKKNHQLNISTQWTTRRPDEVKCFIIPSGYISAIYMICHDIIWYILYRVYANKNIQHHRGINTYSQLSWVKYTYCNKSRAEILILKLLTHNIWLISRM